MFALACLASGAALPSPASAAVDLVTTLSASPSPAVPGDTLTVSVTARNAGDTPATAAYIGLVMLDNVTLAEGAECVNFLGRLAVCSIEIGRASCRERVL